MADHYIDADEIQYYGPHTVEMIRRYLIGLLAQADAYLGYFADELERSSGEVSEEIREARALDAQRRLHPVARSPMLQEGRDFLGRFSRHLGTHKPEAGIDRRSFFTEDGTVRGVGRSAPRVLHTLTRIASLLARENCPVEQAARWQAEAEALAAALAPRLSHARAARVERALQTPAVERSREAWLSVYTSAKCAVESVLRQTGQLHLMPLIFHDLAVASSTKLVAPPPLPTDLPTPPADDEQDD